MLPSFDGLLERRFVQERVEGVHVAKVQIHERIQQIPKWETAFVERREVVLHQGRYPLRLS